MDIIVVDRQIPKHRAPLHMLAYGTVVTLDRQPNCVYIKVNKWKVGAGLRLAAWPEKHSVLFNPKYGTLRSVIATEEVTVIDTEVSATKAEDAAAYFK